MLFLSRTVPSKPLGSYEDGFETDISKSQCTEFPNYICSQIDREPASTTALPSKVILVKRRFAGSPQFLENGTSIIPPISEDAEWPENVDYFAEPSEEVDDAWDRLIGERYLSVSEEESKNFLCDNFMEYVDERKGGYSAG